MELITYRELRRFLNAEVLPDQWGGQFPKIKIIDGHQPPRIEFEVREGKKDKRLLVVGENWLIDQAISEIREFKEKP